MLKGYKYFFYLFVFILHLGGHNLFSQAFQSVNYFAYQGLAQDYIYSLVQDTTGYLWVGTGDGLSRFDGQKFKNFTTEHGLTENFVKTIYIDNTKRIWVGHYEGGVSVFENYQFKKINKGDVSSPINAITQDENGTVWIGTQSDGLLRIKNNTLEPFGNTPELNNILSIITLQDQILLVGTGKGLYQYKIEDKKFSMLGKAPLLSEATIKIIRKNNKKGYWILSKSGLYQLNEDKNFQIDPISFPSDISLESATSIYEDPTSALLIGTEGNGIFKLRVKSSKAELIQQIQKESGLNYPYVKSVIVDRENNIWAGTYGGGLTKLTEQEFRIFKIFNGEENIHISAITKDSNQLLWTGSEAGLSKVDLSSNSINIKTYQSIPEMQKITCLREAGNKDILIGTETNGVFTFNPLTKTFKKFFTVENNSSANRIKDLAVDNNGKSWIATFDGIYIVDSEGKIQAHYTIADGLLHNIINAFYTDTRKNIWVVTQGAGLSKYVAGKFLTYKLPDRTITNINCIAEDNLGKIWVGTNGAGVFTFTRGRFWKRIDTTNGLASNYCYSITTDKNNNLWISHLKGLTKFSLSSKNNEHIEDIQEIPINNLNQNTILKDQDQNIWFATSQNLVKYLPDVEALNINRPTLTITGIDLFFSKVDWKNYCDSLVGESRLPYGLNLKHHDNHLNFHFDAITFRSPEEKQYVYKLEGFDQKWSLPTTQNYATYAKLPPGNYEFKISSVISSGIFSKPASFSFTVLEPIWKTWWFISFMSFAGFLTLGGGIYLRIENLQKKQFFLQRQQEVLLAEINERKIAERELLKSEEKLKLFNQKLEKTNKELSTFIYRSSHDLKGPLMSILGLSQLGKMESKDEVTVDYFNKISKTTSRLDGILKDLMGITEIKDWEVKIEPIDFNLLINDVLKDIKAAKDLSLVTVNINTTLSFVSDYHLIYKGMHAVIENAFTYLKGNSVESKILIDIKNHADGVMIQVEDNGIGICEDALGKVFEMFYKGTESSSGFGLGLYLLSNCIEKLNGSCTIDSKENRYTIVTILLPDLSSPA